MLDSIFTLLLLLLPILSIGIPVLLSVLINKLLRARKVKPKWRLFSLTPIILVGYIIYGAFFPSEEFYKNDFKEVTGIDLVASAKFKFKTADFPDHFGDYMSVSIIELGPEYYIDLSEQLLQNNFTESSKRIGGIEMDKAKKKLKDLTIKTEYSRRDGGKFYYVAFLSDNKSVLVQRSST